MGAATRERLRMGCAAVLGAIVAFPAGMVFSGRESAQLNAPASKATTRTARYQADARKPYSPNILNDPYVFQQHREIVEALEASCRQTHEGCVEAKQARKYLSEREAPPAR